MGVAETLNPGSEVSTLQSYSDAIAGRSLQLFYGVIITASGGVTYGLSRDGGNSRPTTTSEDSVVSGAMVYRNFDVTINKPTILAGICFVDARIQVNTLSGTPASDSVVSAAVIHYDGSTETSLGSSTTENLAPGTDIKNKFKFTVTRKTFGVGSTLRLKMGLWPTPHASNRVSVILHVDPNTAGNELKLWAPVVNLEG